MKGDEKMVKSEDRKNTSDISTKSDNEVEALMTDRQYIEHKWFQGRFFGVLSAAFGTLAEIARVIISRLVFNRNERLNISEIYKSNLRADPSEQIKDEKDQTKEKEQQLELDSNKKDKEKACLKAETRDRIANLIFHEEGVRKAFENIGIGAQPEQNAPNVYLFKTLGEEQGNLQSTVYVMPKEDLIMGKADALASALYAYGEGDKIDCALKSLITVGAVRYLCDQPLFEKGQTSGIPIILSDLEIKTSNGMEKMSLRGSENFKDAVELIVNGEKTALLTLDALKEQSFSEYRDSLYLEVDKKLNPALIIGDGNTLTISRSNNGMSILYTEKDKVTDLGCYSFKTEADVRKLQQEMSEANVDLRIHSKEGVLEHLDISSASYVIGVVANPDMQPNKNDGMYLNTFTGEKEPDGASHLILERTEGGVQVSLFHPSQEDPEYKSTVFEYRNFSSLTDQDIHMMCEAVELAGEMAKCNEYVAKDYVRKDLSNLVQEKENAFHEPIIGMNPLEVKEQYETEIFLDKIEEPERQQSHEFKEAWKAVELEPYPLELEQEKNRTEWDIFDSFSADDPITSTDDPRMLNDPDYIRMQEEECRKMEENEMDYEER